MVVKFSPCIFILHTDCGFKGVIKYLQQWIIAKKETTRVNLSSSGGRIDTKLCTNF